MTSDTPTTSAATTGTPRVVDLRAEHHAPGEALGVGEAAPRLSWRVEDAPDGWRQRRYEVRRAVGDAEAQEPVVVDGPAGADQVLVPWPLVPLSSGEGVLVQVRVTGDDGRATAWSAPEPVEAALLADEDWDAVLVTADPEGSPGAPVPSPAPALRRTLHVDDGLVRARLRLTGHGLVEAWVNGQRVGDEELAPGWTAYRSRLRYRTHDVTDLLEPGDNVLGALLGNGWWRGRLTWGDRRALYGTRRALLAQLELTYADGRTERVVTDGDWRWAPSHVLDDDLYDGEHVDLRRRDDAWAAAGFDDSGWEPVTVLGRSEVPLVAADAPPVRAVRTVPARSVEPSPEEGFLVDLGENVVGRLRVRVRGAAGDRVVVRHAEVLEDGALGVRPLRSARATDTYDLAGAADGEPEVLEPRFTFHGFRYAEVRGVPDLRAEDVEAVVLTSDLPRTGEFSSSHELLDTFHENVRRGMQGNFLDVPTDCPQRDERLGWTGDAQVFAPTASFLAASGGFWVSWLKDVAADQVDGAVPFVVPDVLSDDDGPVPAAAWGDAAVVVPTVVHERTGDVEVLRRQWPSMVAWAERLLREAGDDLLWTGGFQFGDWLDPTAPPDAPAAAQADPDVVATAHLARAARLVERAARVLGRTEDEARWRATAERVEAAFVAEYVTPSGRVLSDCPTVYAVALCWDLLPEGARAHAADRLADLVRTAGFRIATGFVGTPLVTDALATTGHVDVAYRLLLEQGCPSWLYPVTMGATTVWERWDSMLPDGSINPGEMTSFNHYALGAVADWLHRTVAGLAPAEPGYRRLLVRPLPGGGLTRAAARHVTPYGRAAVAWHVEGDRWHLEVVVPTGTTAEVHLPDGSAAQEVGSGTHRFELPADVAAVGGPARATTTSTTREAMADPERWPEVVAAMVEAGVGRDDAEVASMLGGFLDLPLVRAARVVPSRGGTPPGEPLARRVEALLGA
ncbi:glycoside hydrolase family 78 protein [Pseudokineococcus lusitanus]|uniref:alpha-L-rhamnosidase n=1 Tax=Pseudokineococcus lusitanus TaxID=763993 RepID=A0A3N1G8J7_9ACTN|nr:glycoside hydrolase family 78 protein [Pseudokineococcus lusitanus]ROP26565.1 alpha-L-rhamnosidase [Pseudokineococcus lusitanus]